VDDGVDPAAQGEGVGQRVDREVGGHAGADGVADDPLKKTLRK
jgi:hypothetical protein